MLGSELGHGSFTISAEYSNSDGNFNGSTGAVGTPQIVNATLVIGNGPVSFQRARSFTWKIRVPALLSAANAADPGADPLTISAVASPTINGGVVVVNGTTVFSTPPESNGNVTDSFTYIVSDGFGGMAEGMVILTVPAVPLAGAAINPS